MPCSFHKTRRWNCSRAPDRRRRRIFCWYPYFRCHHPSLWRTHCLLNVNWHYRSNYFTWRDSRFGVENVNHCAVHSVVQLVRLIVKLWTLRGYLSARLFFTASDGQLIFYIFSPTIGWRCTCDLTQPVTTEVDIDIHWIIVCWESRCKNKKKTHFKQTTNILSLFLSNFLNTNFCIIREVFELKTTFFCKNFYFILVLHKKCRCLCP